MNDTLFSAVLTMTGVLLGIKAAMGGVRLDWAEVVLVGGVILITVGVIKLFNSMKGGAEDE